MNGSSANSCQLSMANDYLAGTIVQVNGNKPQVVIRFNSRPFNETLQLTTENLYKMASISF